MTMVTSSSSDQGQQGKMMMSTTTLVVCCMMLLALLGTTEAFSSSSGGLYRSPASTRSNSSHSKKNADCFFFTTNTQLCGKNNDAADNEGRRAFLTGVASALLTTTAAATTAVAPNVANAAGAEVRGIEVTPFNSLMFQYRGTDFQGQQAADIPDGEPTVTYADFLQRLKAGEVESVEFLAPDGDAAYVKFKSTVTASSSSYGTGSPIRIGEGYPIEQHDGWSSPSFAIRTVKEFGVPYKFTVPALQAYRQ